MAASAVESWTGVARESPAEAVAVVSGTACVVSAIDVRGARQIKASRAIRDKPVRSGLSCCQNFTIKHSTTGSKVNPELITGVFRKFPIEAGVTTGLE